MSLSRDIAEKSVQAAVASIEIYNKPDFSFREEAFSLLMTNAWEPLLKAKWLADHNDEITTLYDLGNDGRPRLSRSGNPCTHSLGYLAAKLVEDKNSGFDKPTHDNVIALIEIRDNSAHFIHKDLHLGRVVLEIGTASLQNYLQVAGEWFQIDLSCYNFFLMPLSFYHGFEAITTSVSPQPVQVQRLVEYLISLENQNEGESTRHVAIRLHTRFVRSRDDSAIAFKWTDDPAAPAVRLAEEDILKNYPLTYRDLTNQLRRRYKDFIENRDYHRIRQKIEKVKKLSIIRTLDPRNPKSAKQRFYNSNIIQEFDKHYKRRKKVEPVATPDRREMTPASQ
ncbi:MAG: DUF3644 domain-containing protein [Thermodesulfobacteriota bacterium]|jgi:hypothetical protein|nr:MAG: DUF3644 domain-containing protein [Thermodesulfobacteriota bacterium]